LELVVLVEVVSKVLVFFFNKSVSRCYLSFIILSFIIL